MRAKPEPLSATVRPLPREALELLAAAVDEALAGVAVVDARSGTLRVAYANDAFCAQAQCGASRPDDFVLDDAVGFGGALAEATRACRGAGAESRRIGYRLGGSLLAADVTITRSRATGRISSWWCARPRRRRRWPRPSRPTPTAPKRGCCARRAAPVPVTGTGTC